MQNYLNTEPSKVFGDFMIKISVRHIKQPWHMTQGWR